MSDLIKGQAVGSWQSNLGQATITVKKEIGSGHASQEAAARAAFGQQSVLTRESDGKYHAYAIDDGAYGDDLDLGESVSLKTGIPNVKVLDLVGGDGYQLLTARKIMPPLGPDNGKVVYFVRNTSTNDSFTFLRKANNFGYAGFNPESRWQEEIKQARKKGYSVIVDPRVTEHEMQAVFYDQRTAGVVFFGHGGTGYAAVDNEAGTEKRAFEPSDLNAEHVSANLKFVYWQSCSTNTAKAEWEKVLPGATSYGWKRTVYAHEVAVANDPPTFDLTGPTSAADNGGRLDRILDRHL